MTPALATGLVRIVDTDAHEGPTWFADEDALYVTTTRGQAGTAILRIALDGLAPVGPDAVTVLRADANLANGMTADAAGRLVVCEQGTRTTPARISAVDRVTGEASTLVDSVDGLPLNSPNDVVVRRDGTIWFTDPAYGAAQGFRPSPQLPDSVYRFDPASGALDVVATGFDHPNGLAFAPDERVLYVGDSGADRGDGRHEPARPHHVLAFPVDGDRLGTPVPFAQVPGAPDGIVTDARGRVLVGAPGGVHVFAPTGEPVELIELPGAVNLTAGPAGALFVTADTAVWAVVPRPEGDLP